MRPKKATIPSAFLPFDTNVTAADRVVNTRDQHVFKQNHNALLAERVRKDLVSQACSKGTSLGPTAYNYWRFTPRNCADGEPHSRILSIPIFVTQLTQKIRFWVRACKSSLDGESTLDEDPLLYVVPHEPQIAYQCALTANALTVTSATGTPATYAVDVAIPPRSGEHSHHYGRMPYILDVYIKTFIDDTNALHAGAAMTDVDRGWFVANIGPNHERDVVYPDVSHIEPRQIVRADTLIHRYWLDVPWTDVPDTAATLTVREVLGVDLYGFGVEELAITDFSADYAL